MNEDMEKMLQEAPAPIPDSGAFCRGKGRTGSCGKRRSSAAG